jgi:Ribosomal protein L6e
VNSRYVIATSTKVDVKGVDRSTLDKIADEKYFAREKKSKKEKGEETFMKQGEKPEVSQPPPLANADSGTKIGRSKGLGRSAEQFWPITPTL